MIFPYYRSRPSDTSFVEDDGSLRLYNLPEGRVHKAVRGLGSDISSIAWVHPLGTEIGNVWVAAGQKVCMIRRVLENVGFLRRLDVGPQIFLFGLDAPAMIQDASHSLVSLDGIIDPEDVFNEVIMLGGAPEGDD
jgi:hypothetical protein